MGSWFRITWKHCALWDRPDIFFWSQYSPSAKIRLSSCFHKMRKIWDMMKCSFRRVCLLYMYYHWNVYLTFLSCRPQKPAPWRSHPRVRIYGDSILRNIHREMWSDDYIFDVRAKPGCNFRSLATYIKDDDEYIPMETMCIVIHVGTNNLPYERLLARDMRDLLYLINAVREKFNLPVLVSAVLPRFDDYGELVRHFNVEIAKMCKKLNVAFFNIGGDFQSPNLFSDDGLHFSPKGKEEFGHQMTCMVTRSCATFGGKHVPLTATTCTCCPTTGEKEEAQEGSLNFATASTIITSSSTFESSSMSSEVDQAPCEGGMWEWGRVFSMRMATNGVS